MTSTEQELHSKIAELTLKITVLSKLAEDRVRDKIAEKIDVVIHYIDQNDKDIAYEAIKQLKYLVELLPESNPIKSSTLLRLASITAYLESKECPLYKNK